MERAKPALRASAGRGHNGAVFIAKLSLAGQVFCASAQMGGQIELVPLVSRALGVAAARLTGKAARGGLI